MPELILWKNKEIGRFRREMDLLFDRLWDDFGASPFPAGGADALFVDVLETEDALEIRAEIPGIDPQDLEVSLTETRLTIKGDMRQQVVKERGIIRRMERRYGRFSRTLRLPCRVRIDQVTAHYEKGILRIVAQKSRPDLPRAVKVKVI